tara:strand:+ start:487 stop:1044 length:558 start_codon:yes stop_codon:yes gene_type:complete
MNIFVVNKSPEESARSLCDKHIVKMVLESAQMISTAHRVLDGWPCERRNPNGRLVKDWMLDDEREDLIYRGHQPNHPCTIWTRQTTANYDWHCEHAMELSREYTRRYDKVHKVTPILEYLSRNQPENLPVGSLTPFAQAMPEVYKDPENAVIAYRNYYINTKARFAKWKMGNIPIWFKESCIDNV